MSCILKRMPHYYFSAKTFHFQKQPIQHKTFYVLRHHLRDPRQQRQHEKQMQIPETRETRPRPVMLLCMKTWTQLQKIYCTAPSSWNIYGICDLNCILNVKNVCNFLFCSFFFLSVWEKFVFLYSRFMTAFAISNLACCTKCQRLLLKVVQWQAGTQHCPHFF